MATCETTQSEAGLAPIKDSISESLDRIQRVNRATTNLVVGYSHYERLLEAHCAACNSLNTFEDLHDPPTTTTAVNEVFTLSLSPPPHTPLFVSPLWFSLLGRS
jgi:hypothetical protein